MDAVRCNFDDVQETKGSCLYGCKYYLVGLASIMSPDNTLIPGKRNFVENMLKNVGKEAVTRNGENINKQNLIIILKDIYGRLYPCHE